MFAPTATLRRRQLQQHIPDNELWVFVHPSHVRYLTGFQTLVVHEREAVLFITKQHALLCHAYFSPAPESLGVTLQKGCRPTQLEQHLRDWLPTAVTTGVIERVAWDDEFVSVAEGDAIRASFGKEHPIFRTLNLTALWQLRTIKTAPEIAAMKQAATLTAQQVAVVSANLQSGITEQELQRQLDGLLLQHGSTGPAFPTIVAFGEHTALPHHQPTSKPLRPEMPVLIDCGATIDGYCSDMSRSWWFGDKATPEYTAAHDAVMAAYQKALLLLNQPHSAPITAAAVDNQARRYLDKQGYGKAFIHTTGHGLGLDIHEPPSLSINQTQPLQAGMVITIEPGVYFEGKWGIRYENTILIAESSAAELTML